METKPNAFICGTARNCENYIEAVFANIKQLETLFNKVHIIVSYDVSEDKTLLNLVHQKKHYKERMEILIGPYQLTPIRTANISRARNAILDKIRTFNPEEWPYFIMIDMDDVCATPIKLGPLERVMRETDKWDSCSFNRAGYYDIWALSYPPYIYSCWGWVDPRTVVHTMQEDIIYKLRETPDHEYFPVLSAFNGFAIYKTPIFLHCHYDWQMPKKYMKQKDLKANQQILGFRETFSPLNQQTDEADCEHRHFHMQAVYDYGAKIVICPEEIF